MLTRPRIQKRLAATPAALLLLGASTWKSESSQLLRPGQLRWGSNLFHGGILFLFFGQLFGQLTPHERRELCFA